jgi:type IV secretion system protein VirD4
MARIAVKGALVVGEAYDPRDDEGPFYADDPSTWGPGGKAPLLLDRLREGSTHSLVYAGSGGLKTLSTVIPNLLTFGGAAVVMDPKENLAGMMRDAREAMGKRVVVLEPGKPGFNTIGWINPNSPMLGIDIDGVIEDVCGHTSQRDQKNAFFKNEGKSIVKALIANLVEDSRIPIDQKTLWAVRKQVAVPSSKLIETLQDISQNSPSEIAKDLAGAISSDLENAPEMFAGIHRSATRDTAWIGDPAYASLVSGNAFNVQDLVLGDTDVFIALPLTSLIANPAPAKAILGGLMSAVYQAKGKLPGGRIFFEIEEAARLGKMHILEVARDAGREYGLTIEMILQSPGQLRDDWGESGKQAWEDSVSRRCYSGVKSPATASEICKALGSYGVVNLSETQSIGYSRARPFQPRNRSTGKNVTHSWGKRELMKEDEIMYDLRPDAQIVFPYQGRPAICRRAWAPGRPEMVARVNGMY